MELPILANQLTEAKLTPIKNCYDFKANSDRK
jgi:hypothetical protein